MTIIFATCDHLPGTTPDDQPLADALGARGVMVTPIPWTEIAAGPTKDAPPVLLRSTWDYHRMPARFASWLMALEDSGRTVWNDPATARANIDKVYLQHLETAGVAIPRTRWLDRPDNASIDRALVEEQWDRAVLKPRIAATAYGTHLVSRGMVLGDEDLAPARASGALLQEFIPEIETTGETSLVYCDAEFSHAVSKRARDGDFRVQKDFGGTVEPLTPSAGLVAFADRVLSLVPAGLLYARVDLVDTARGPLLMELELIEPELYFTIVPAGAERMADAIVRRIS